MTTPTIRRPTPSDMPFSRDVPTFTVVSSNLAAAAGRVVELQFDRLVIGREASCTLVLNDARLSRRHAELRVDGAHFVLLDLSSTNGTWVNGVRSSRQRLHHGDSVRLGSTVFRFGDTNQRREDATSDEIARATACVQGNLTHLQQSFADGSLTLEALDELVRDCQQSVERLADQARAAAPGSADDVTPPVTRNTGRS